MAESAISSVVQSLSNLLIQEGVFLKGVRGQVEWLRDELQRMQCFLKDADAKQEDDPRVKNWVSEIRNAAYDAEDIIDAFMLKIESQNQKNFFRRCAYIFKEPNDLHEVGKKIESLKDKLNDISRSRVSYDIRSFEEGMSSNARENLRRLRWSSPRGLEKDLVGLKTETAQLVAQLLQTENRLTVISIVGIGGLGRTTLAKRLFNHDDVKNRFECRAWVYVSQEYRPKEILQGILRDTSPTKRQLQIIETAQEHVLEQMLYNHLKEKCYFVVLDDIWSIEAWDVLARAFPDTNNGSKLLLTTRNRDVALHADGRSEPHELKLLSENDSWELFLSKAFVDDEPFTRCPPELEEVARKIVGKCDGLPLAIVVIGGLLSRKRQVREWERVLNNIDSHFAAFARRQNGVFPILALSYSDLPHYLKPCFLHLDLFPEDYVIRTRKLFSLWIAEGLIPQGEERMESIAEDYLNELTERNLVQVVRTSASKRIKECQVHNVLRELSISKAKEEIFLEIHGEKDVVPSEKTRHQAIYSNFDRYVQLKPSIPRLRSLHFFCRDDWRTSEEFSQFICTSFKLLRVLDLQGIRGANLSSEIGQLINLRYLGLHGCEIIKLPSSIKYLRSLQTLDLSGGPCPCNVSNVICKMENLRNLYLGRGNRIGPLRTDKLRHLQTLLFVRVDDWVQNDTENLKSLLKLGVLVVTEFSDTGKFINSIAKLEHLLSLYMVFTARLPSLTGLSHLQRLTKLRMEQVGSIQSKLHEFPPNLTQLTLRGIDLDQRTMSTLRELPKLSVLKLRNSSYETEELTIFANEFPQLQFLQFDNLWRLTKLMIETGAMPRLRHCRIIRFKNLTIFCSGSVLSAFHEAEIQESIVQIFEASSRADIPECSSGVADE